MTSENKKGNMKIYRFTAPPLIKTIMLNPLKWKKYCTYCDTWFRVDIKPPGTKIARNVPPICPDCVRKINKSHEERAGISKNYYPANRKQTRAKNYRWTKLDYFGSPADIKPVKPEPQKINIESFKNRLDLAEKSLAWFYKKYINPTGLGYRIFCFDLENNGMGRKDIFTGVNKFMNEYK